MNEEKFIFENLSVYQKSLKLSIEICKVASKFPFAYSRIRDQFVGAIVSIPLNIAEGNGRLGIKDRVKFYVIARSSSFECIPLIDICFNLELIDNNFRTIIRQEIKEISSMISGLIKYNHNK